MTASTIRPVCWKLPVDRLTVCRMATGTNHTEAMISRISGRGMIEVDGQPVGGVMAFVTLQVGHKMSGGFSCRRGAIVTGGTTPCHQTMIHVGWRPSQVIMTTIALS